MSKNNVINEMLKLWAGVAFIVTSMLVVGGMMGAWSKELDSGIMKWAAIALTVMSVGIGLKILSGSFVWKSKNGEEIVHEGGAVDDDYLGEYEK